MPLDPIALSLADELVSFLLGDNRIDYSTPDGIVRFVREVIGAEPTPYQEDVLRNFVIHKRAAVRGPHGLGKTSLSSWVILWAVCAFPPSVDVKVVTTASAWRQLTYYTWPEVHKWVRNPKADWSKVGVNFRRGKELLERNIKLNGREAFPVASNDPQLIEGAHATKLVYVFDEAKAIPDGVWDAAEGAFSTAGDDTEGDAYALAISTPGNPSGRFYDIHKRKPGYEDWWVRHVKLEEAIAAGRISQEWADRRKAQWGEKSAIYQSRVEGNFAESGEDVVIPLAWIEQANERWLACEGKGEGAPHYGVDVARYGQDKTAIARLVGRVLESIDTYSQEDTMQTTGRVSSRIKADTQVAVDVIGIGAGVVDRLAELGYYNVVGVNVAHGTDLTTGDGLIGFVNLRSAVWWMFREAMNPNGPEPLALPPIDELTGDLTTPTYKYTSKGLIQVESKDDIRKRLGGRSTDYGDAAILAYYATFAVADWDYFIA